MSPHFKNFWQYFIPGAITNVVIMLALAMAYDGQVDWLNWWLITLVLVLVWNGILSLAVSGETTEQREQREMSEMDHRIAAHREAKGIK